MCYWASHYYSGVVLHKRLITVVALDKNYAANIAFNVFSDRYVIKSTENNVAKVSVKN